MKILITAGMHGNEQSALLAVMKYREMIAARDDLDLDVDFAIINHYGLFNDQRNMRETPQEKVFDPNRMWEPVNIINGWGSASSAAEAIKEKLKKAIKDGLSEDNEKDAELELQKVHDKFIKKIDELITAKNKEIMTV